MNSVKMTLLSMSSRSSVDRAPARCSGGHGFDSYNIGDSDFFFVPRSCHVDQFTFHISLLSLKFTIFTHLSLLTMTSTGLILAVCRTRVTYELSKWPCSPWVLVAQWIERLPGVREVMGSIPIGDSDFFFVPCSCHVDQFTLHNNNIISVELNDPFIFRHDKQGK